jgi:hypothetical protein
MTEGRSGGNGAALGGSWEAVPARTAEVNTEGVCEMLHVPEGKTPVQPEMPDQDERVDTDRPMIWDAAFHDWGKLDPAKIEPRRWLYGRHYLAGALSATIADGAIGKSILALTEAIAIVTGLPLLGVTPTTETEEGRERDVIYYNAEESLAEIERRVCAICQHFGIDRIKLSMFCRDKASKKNVKCGDGTLRIISGHDLPLTLGRTRNGEVVFDEHHLACLETANGVVILDPFVSIHQCPENDNSAIDAIIKRLARLAVTSGAGVELVHHSRKASGGITGADARGASAIFDGVRALRVLNRMTDTEAQRARVEDDPRAYFRVDDDKANYSSSLSATTWMQHKSVRLPNGDDVGVVVPWRAPGVFDNITAEQVEQIRELASGGNYRVDPRAQEWIGGPVADVLRVDIEDEIERENIKAVLKKLYEDGTLKSVSRRNEETRHMRMVVEAGSGKKKARK